MILALLLLSVGPAWQTPAPTPEERALAFLTREVPRWFRENKCYSCHNNGDGARALYLARQLGVSVEPSALADTTAWLTRPQAWDKNGGEGPFSDKKLARLQFTASLLAAREAGLVKDELALRQAAALVAVHQEKDGSWQVEAEGSIGSPATHGTALATHFARRTLKEADAERYRDALVKSDQWLRTTRVQSVLDAAAILLALADSRDEAAVRQKHHCLDLLRKGQGKDGGWGPFLTSPAEVFDTALVLLALASQPRDAERQAMLRRGRHYLLARQQEDGGWPETTRPPGSESYAQRLATTGWATQALLATQKMR